jgi:hypothetical protein
MLRLWWKITNFFHLAKYLIFKYIEGLSFILEQYANDLYIFVIEIKHKHYEKIMSIVTSLSNCNLILLDIF